MRALPLGAVNVNSPLTFPTNRSTRMRGHSTQAFTSSLPLTILHKDAGSRGVVKCIDIVIKKIGAESAMANDLGKWNLVVWYDGAYEDFDPAYADINVPLASIVGYEFSRQVQDSAQQLRGTLFDPDNAINATKYNTGAWDTRWFSVGVGGSLWAPSQGFQCSLRWPIPYTNGITIMLYPNSITSDMWVNCIYQDGLPPGWNTNLKMFVAYNEADIAVRNSGTGWLLGTNGTAKINTTTGVLTKVDGAGATGTFIGSGVVGTCISDQNVTSGNIDHDVLVTDILTANTLQCSLVDVAHGVVHNGDLASGLSNPNKRIDFVNQHTLIDLASGRGFVPSIFMALLSNVSGGVTSSPGNARIYEANPRIFLDGATEPDLTWTGTEDFAASAFYWDSGKQCSQYQMAGVTSLAIDPPEVAFYRHFDEDLITFDRGIKILWPNLGATGSAGTLTMHQTRMASAVVYYLDA